MAQSQAIMEKKESAISAFRKIRAIDAQMPPYDRYSAEGRITERKEAGIELHEFWQWWFHNPNIQRRTGDTLFSKEFCWQGDSGEYDQNFRGGKKGYYNFILPEVINIRHESVMKPNEAVMRLFILLTEPEGVFGPESAAQVRDTFENLDMGACIEKVDRKKIADMLYINALARLIQCLGGKQIAGLFSELNNYKASPELDAKFATCLFTSNMKISELAEHYALAQFSGLQIDRLRHAGRHGEYAAMEIYGRMLEMQRDLKSSLDILQLKWNRENEKK
jgi:hypothetical protein